MMAHTGLTGGWDANGQWEEIRFNEEPPWAPEGTSVYGFRPNDIGGYAVLGGNGNSAANYPHPGWAYVALEETTPLTCSYCGGTFGADDVRCRGCGADARSAA